MTAVTPERSAGGQGGTAIAERPGDSPVRHALRRLSVYLRRNWRHYLGWFGVTVLYVGAFVSLPRAVGWTIDGLIEPFVSRDQVIERCWVIFALAVMGGVLRFFSRQMVFDAASKGATMIISSIQEGLAGIRGLFQKGFDILPVTVGAMGGSRFLDG